MSSGASGSSAARRNGIWSAIQQSAAMGSNALIAILLVRQVPVEDYGHYSYALGLASIGVAVMTAGLSGLAVRSLVNDRPRNAEIIAGLMITREAFAVLAYGIVAAIALTSGDANAMTATLVSALALFGRAMDAPDMWFLSELRSRETVVLRLGVTGVLLVVRIGLLVVAPSIWIFLALYVVEAFIVSLLIVIRYLLAKGSPRLTKPDMKKTLLLVRKSFPLLLSSFANQVNLKGDLIYIQAILGAPAVGLYAAAARLSELAYFLPVAFMNATMPHMLRVRREHGPESWEYRSLMQRSYDQAFWVGVGVALLVASCGSGFIYLVFGERYLDSIPVLVLHSIACPFVFMAAVYSKWIIAEDILWSSLWRHVLGVTINLSLNLILLPIIGIKGAAIATLASYIVASYGAAFIGRKSRLAGFQMTLAIVAPARYLLRKGGRENDK